MIGPDHMRVVLIRFAVLFCFIVALWVIQLVNWATGYDLNLAFGDNGLALAVNHCTGLDVVVVKLPKCVLRRTSVRSSVTR